MQRAQYLDWVSASYRVDITPSLSHEELEEVSRHHVRIMAVIPLTTTMIPFRSTHVFNLSPNSSAPKTILATPIQCPSFLSKLIICATFAPHAPSPRRPPLRFHSRTFDQESARAPTPTFASTPSALSSTETPTRPLPSADSSLPWTFPSLLQPCVVEGITIPLVATCTLRKRRLKVWISLIHVLFFLTSSRSRRQFRPLSSRPFPLSLPSYFSSQPTLYRPLSHSSASDLSTLPLSFHQPRSSRSLSSGASQQPSCRSWAAIPFSEPDSRRRFPSYRFLALHTILLGLWRPLSSKQSRRVRSTHCRPFPP